MAQILIVAHDVEVDIRTDSEEPEHLVEHLAVLPGRDHQEVELVGRTAGFEDYRRQLDRLGPRAEDDHETPSAGLGTHSGSLFRIRVAMISSRTRPMNWELVWR